MGALLLAVALLLAPAIASAEASADDKRSYTLFSPVPRDLMRGLAPERPGVTETPTTVDAGHFQLDTEFVGYEYEDRAEEPQNTVSVLETTLNVGLTRRLAAQLVLTPYQWELSDSSTESGFGDLTFRLKSNLWGNDPRPGQTTAAAVVGEITVPTGTEVSSDELEGSIIGVLAWNASARIALGTQIQFEFLHDTGSRRHDTDLIHTLIASTSALAPLSLQIEYVGKARLTGEHGYRPGIGAGAAYAIDENMQLDVDVRVGLGSSADFDSERAETGRVNVSTGITMRF